ncbi:cell division cycle-associated protein 7-like [Megalops cyprinoides]|uniref:cell division cycle-associated protein 7-like n=1 Tax=Megalops cyprinoides TaxID=118141 RepID=UPI001863FC5D|nr:cell division cycle-associated protein 7-like [Megalops cyprinoides]
MEKEDRLGVCSLSQKLADLFAEDSDSENDKTFYGFSDSELSDIDDVKALDSDECSKRTPPKQPAPQRFTLRVALRPRRHATSREGEEEERPEPEDSERGVKLEDGGQALTRTPPPPKTNCDSDTEEPETFLEKRALNIKANKAMLAQLMADLQKMPGSLLKAPAGGRQKQAHSRPPRASMSAGESRRNPERSSRRHTRSMGQVEDPPDPEEDKDLALTLEQELLEVRRPPRRRGNPRPNQGKPHIVRPVEDITEEEIELVADSMVDKVYNSVTGSTCHQCRQKTVDTKTCCRNEGCRGIQGQFCGPCLRNRYGEDVRKALLDPNWQCPPCRGICNCSFCRQRDGRCPTGILFPLAQYHGFSDVHSYLISLKNKLKTGEEET